MLRPYIGIVAKGIIAVAPKVAFLIPDYEYLKGGDQGEERTSLPDSDFEKVISALMGAGVSRISRIPYRTELAYPLANEAATD